MKFKAIRIYPQLFILILLLRNSVSAQIDWAEDEDDPGKHSVEIIYEHLPLHGEERNGHFPSLILVYYTHEVLLGNRYIPFPHIFRIYPL